MRNNRGQALIEFVILLPVFMMLILGILDLGNIIYHKYQLGNDLDYISDLYIENKIDEINKYVNDREIHHKISDENNKANILISDEVKIITPGLNIILGKYYTVSVERMLYHE